MSEEIRELTDEELEGASGGARLGKIQRRGMSNPIAELAEERQLRKDNQEFVVE